MKQPAGEFKIDPHQPIGTEEMPTLELPSTFLKDHEKWATNTALARQHKFCSTLCVNFKTGSAISQTETACLNNCFNKYVNAFGSFQQEKQQFLASLSELQLRGEDRYLARDI